MGQMLHLLVLFRIQSDQAFPLRTKPFHGIPFVFLADPASTIIHSVRFLQEDYYKDYQDVRKRRFKARKLEIEQKVSEEIHHLKGSNFLLF